MGVLKTLAVATVVPPGGVVCVRVRTCVVRVPPWYKKVKDERIFGLNLTRDEQGCGGFFSIS